MKVLFDEKTQLLLHNSFGSNQHDAQLIGSSHCSAPKAKSERPKLGVVYLAPILQCGKQSALVLAHALAILSGLRAARSAPNLSAPLVWLPTLTESHEPLAVYF